MSKFKLVTMLSFLLTLNGTVYSQECKDIKFFLQKNYYNSLDSASVLAEAGSHENDLVGASYKNISFSEDSISGKSILLNKNSYLSLCTKNIINESRGRVTLWIQPNWNGNELTEPAYLLNTGILNVNIWNSKKGHNYFSFNLSDKLNNKFEVSTSHEELNGQPIVMNWKKGEWHKITIEWNLTLNPGEQYLKYEIDNKHSEITYGTWSGINSFDKTFSIGSSFGRHPFKGKIDEFKSYYKTPYSFKSKNKTLSIDSAPIFTDKVNSIKRLTTLNTYLTNIGNNLNNQKGEISFNFTLAEWNPRTNKQARYLIDSNVISVKFWYKDQKTYLSAVLNDKNNKSFEISTSQYELSSKPVVMNWKKGETHDVKLTWNLNLPDSKKYFKMVIDEKQKNHRTNIKKYINNKSFSTPKFYKDIYLGTNKNETYQSGLILNNLKFHSDHSATKTFSLSLVNKDYKTNYSQQSAYRTLQTDSQSYNLTPQGLLAVEGNPYIIKPDWKFNSRTGSMNLKFQPNWDGIENNKTQYLLHSKHLKLLFFIKPQTGRTYLEFALSDGYQTAAASTTADASFYSNNGLDGIIAKWKKGQVYNIEIIWDFIAERPYIGIIVDGKETVINYLKEHERLKYFEISDLNIGSSIKGRHTADGYISILNMFSGSSLTPTTNLAEYIAKNNGNGIIDSHENYYNSTDYNINLSKITNKDIIFFQKQPYSTVFEGSTPTVNEITEDFFFLTSRNQTDTFFINLHSIIDLDESTLITIDDFTKNSSSNSILKPKLFLVKNWWQAGTGAMKNLLPVYVPELLIKSDTSADGKILESINKIKEKNWSSKNLPNFNPKKLPDNQVEINFKAHTSKQLAVSLDIPKNIKPGFYSSKITLISKNGIKRTAKVGLRVLPITLAEHDKKVWIYNTGAADFEIPGSSTNPDQAISKERYFKQYQDIKDHGFNGMVSFNAKTDTKSNKIKMDYVKSINWDLDFIFNKPSQELYDLMVKEGYEPLFYGVDEPSTPAMHKEHIKKASNIKQFTRKGMPEAKVTSAVFYDVVLEYLTGAFNLPIKNNNNAYYKPLDIYNYTLNNSKDYFDGLIDGTEKRKIPGNEMYYWQTIVENPILNRAYAGFYFWNTKLDGIVASSYQDVRRNPYDDFDYFSQNNFRDHLTTYPSQNGPVRTIQWEALREGIDDYRLLLTWKRTVEKKRSTHPKKATESEKIVNSSLNKYKKYSNMKIRSMSDFEDTKLTIMREIIKLNNL